MKKYYLKTMNGSFPIEQAIVDKYNLKMGTMSPFTRNPIVDQNGEAPVEKDPADHGLDAQSKGELVNDGISQLDNGITLSTSEIIDISQGVDSQSK